MKILVLGSKGQLGRCLNDQLENDVDTIIYTSREQIDVSAHEATENKILEIKPNVVINATGYTAVDKAEEEQEMAELINNLAVANIAHTCNKLNTLLVHVSTDYVFDGTSIKAYSEDDETNPLNIYGLTKLKGEMAVQSSGCRYIIIRTSWIFSEYGNNFLKTMLRLSSECNEISVVGDQFGCPTYAQDIAKAIKKILYTNNVNLLSSSLYHYSGNQCVSWAEFSKEIFSEALKLKVIKNIPDIVSIDSKKFSTLAKRPSYSALSSSKISYNLGIDASDFKPGIRSCLSALKKI